MPRPQRRLAKERPPPTLPLGRRLLLGSAIALVSVVMFLGALEGTLRLVGFGHDARFYRVVQDADGHEWLRENRDFALTFFAPELVRRPHPFRLPAKKEPGTYRIVVLGESAARGDPAAAFSIARTLEAMLRAAYPERRFEVVNAGITAINSHAVRLIAADCAQLEPDLFLIYAGHNEVIGPFGPAAVLAPFMRSPLVIDSVVRLRRTRTGQLLGAAARALGRGRPDLERWGGMTMFLEHEIAIDDPRLRDVENLFTRNLRAITASARAVGAHTLLCTVLTNQRDFPPFRSRHRDGLTDDLRRQWDDAFAAGQRALADHDVAAAEAAWRRAWAIDSQFAELAFQLGRLCLAQGRDAEAAAFLERALDCDTLRFRTDARLQAAIRQVGERNSAGVELVELADAMARQSPHGIVGDEALYEHVHLTFQATWQVARILFGRVSEDLIRRRLIDAVAAEPLSYAEVRQRLAYTVFEQAMIIDEMLERFSHPPFNGQSNQAERLALWRQRQTAIAKLADTPENRRQLEEQYEAALAQAPDDWILARNYGWMLAAFDQPERAITWLERAHAVIDSDTDTLFALIGACRASGRAAEADAYLTALRHLSPHHPGLPENAQTVTRTND